MRIELTSARNPDGEGYDHNLEAYDEAEQELIKDDLLNRMLAGLPSYQRAIDFNKQGNERSLSLTPDLGKVVSQLYFR